MRRTTYQFDTVDLPDARVGDFLRFPSGERPLIAVDRTENMLHYATPAGLFASLDDTALHDLGGSIVRRIPLAWEAVSPLQVHVGDEVLLEFPDHMSLLVGSVTHNDTRQRNISLKLTNQRCETHQYDDGGWFRKTAQAN